MSRVFYKFIILCVIAGLATCNSKEVQGASCKTTAFRHYVTVKELVKEYNGIIIDNRIDNEEKIAIKLEQKSNLEHLIMSNVNSIIDDHADEYKTENMVSYILNIHNNFSEIEKENEDF